MIKPKCDKCLEELDEFGAIVLSPPDSVNMVRKFHLCVTCYEKLFNDYFYKNEVSDSELLKIYYHGFSDELDDLPIKIFNYFIKDRAYNIGRDDAIIGHNKFDEDILKHIKSY